MNISELSESKYLKKEDCSPPIKVTILSITKDNLAKDNEAPEYKFILNFKECKPLVLNKTNGKRIALVLGSPETDDWINKQIDLFNDPTVEFAGELKGGIRVLVPQPAPAQLPIHSGVNQPARALAPGTVVEGFDEPNDDIPF